MAHVAGKKKQLISRINQSLVLNTIRKNGLIARSEIAEKTGIVKPTVTAITHQLLKKNLIREVGYGDSTEQGGRRPIYLQVANEANCLIGIDIGSHRLRGVLVDLGENVIESISVPTPLSSKEELLDKVEEIVIVLMKVAEENRAQIKAVGIACSGTVNSQTGKVIKAANISVLNGVNLAKEFKRRIKLPIAVYNAVGCSLIAEKSRAGENSNLMLLTWGGGIGIGVSIGKKVFTGGQTAEVWDFGHIAVNPEGRKCRCGRDGCLEAYVSTDALVERAQKQGLAVNKINDLITLALGGDPEARVLMEDAAKLVGETLVYFLQFFRTEMLVIAGCIAELGGEIVVPHLHKALFEKLGGAVFADLVIQQSEIGELSGAIGAANYVSHLVFNTPLVELLNW
jgi:predicted NBD/HSP70 family sugar kinase